jgi:two-component system NtrC family sensor kinase
VVPSQLCDHHSNRVLLFEAGHRRAAEVKAAFARACPDWKVSVVKRSGEAIRRLEGQTYDAVILNLDPLRSDDLDLVRQFAKTGRGIPIVVLAGPCGEQVREAAGTQSSVVCLFGSSDDLDSLPLAVADVLGRQGLELKQAQLQEEILNREKELDALKVFADALAEATVADEVLRCALEAARSAIPHVDAATGHLMDEENGWLFVGVPADAGSPSRATSGQLEHKGVSSSPQAMDSEPGASGDSRCPELGPGVESCLTAPLIIQEEVVGRLSVGSAQAGAFDERRQAVLTTLARQASAAIENARLRRQIQTTQREYRMLVESASDAVCVVDLETWRFLETNLQAGELTGHGLEGLQRVTADGVRCMQGDSPESVTLRDLITSGESGFEDLSLVRRDGRLVPVSVRVNRPTRGDAKSAQVVLRDLSARKEMEQRLIHTEKLAALGRLAASLAHEINNPLQALRSSISLLSRDLLDEEKRMRYVSIADQEVQRLIQLVQRMLDFYRPASEERDLVCVNDLLEDTLALASKQLEHCGIVVVRDFTEELPPVGAVVSYLRQVFINLVLYHVEAMPDGGRLTVSTSVDEIDDQVVITFGDTGEGIPADELPYVFEPFYSAREKSGGLGLAVSYSIVEKHGGLLEVSSEEGAGTHFSVRLPVGGEPVV